MGGWQRKRGWPDGHPLFLYSKSFFREAISKQCPWIAILLPALLVVGIPQAPMNAEFHSAAARPLDAFIKLRIAVNLEFEKFILLVLLVKNKNRAAILLPDSCFWGLGLLYSFSL